MSSTETIPERRKEKKKNSSLQSSQEKIERCSRKTNRGNNKGKNREDSRGESRESQESIQDNIRNDFRENILENFGENFRENRVNVRKNMRENTQNASQENLMYNNNSHGSSRGNSAESVDTYITDENGNSVILPKPDVNSNMVYLNIYDLDSVSKVVNSVARTMGTGAFHAGVEVYGHEYSFGYIVDGETGVTKTKARCHPYHVYRETIPMGKTPLTKEEVDILVEVMKMQWIGDTYDLLSRNCLNYADYFCNLLDVGGVPDWVMSLQKRITWMKSNISVAATKIKALNKAAGIPSVLKFLRKKSKDSGKDFEGCKVIIKS